MISNLLSNTATLIARIPDHIQVPPFQEKSRAKKCIIRTIIKLLQTKQLELLYAGFDTEGPSKEKKNVTGDAVVVSINILKPGRAVCDFNSTEDVLMRRFKKELQINNEHILIDQVILKEGTAQRHIDVFVKSRTPERLVYQPNFTYAVSSGSYPAFSRGY
jgi:hypothetical protein